MGCLREKINDSALEAEQRLAALCELKKARGIHRKSSAGEINNHVHSIYSFSPYTPSMLTLLAYEAGLEAVGLVDHDSLAGATEFLAAARTLNLAATVGLELRTFMKDAFFAKRKINSPDMPGLCYLVLHGVAESSFAAVKEFLVPIQERRNQRNREQTKRLNSYLLAAKLPVLDYDADIVKYSQKTAGGSVTERHILWALAQLLSKIFPQKEQRLNIIERHFTSEIGSLERQKLLAADNPHYYFDLLGVLKSRFLPKIFVQPDEKECLSLASVVKFANEHQIIPTYPYLGDVSSSPTGDKKSETFEDSFLEPLLDHLQLIGVKAISYMPPRNSLEQIQRLQKLCRNYNFMEISGVDINSSRQSFNTPLLLQAEFQYLNETSWALIAHEKLSNLETSFAFFSAANPLKSLDFQRRMKIYASLGKRAAVSNEEQLKKIFQQELSQLKRKVL